LDYEEAIGLQRERFGPFLNSLRSAIWPTVRFGPTLRDRGAKRIEPWRP